MTVDAIGLRGLGGHNGLAAQEVHAVGDSLKMIWIGARTNAACVIWLLSLGDRSLEKFVGNLVRFAIALAVLKPPISLGG